MDYIKKKKIQSILINGVIILTLFLSACQPTPEEQVVVGKLQTPIKKDDASTDEANSDIIFEEENSQEERWIEEFESRDKRFDVFIDALIEMPVTLPFKKYSAKPLAFTKEQIDSIIDVLCQNKSLYEFSEYGKLTKEKAEKEIILLKKLQASNIESVEEIDGTIKMLEELYNDLPSKEELMIDSISKDVLYGDEGSALVDLGKTSMGSLFIRNNINESDIRLQFANYGYWDGYTNESIISEQPTSISITLEEAKNMANNIISKLGIENMAFSNAFVANAYSANTFFPDYHTEQDTLEQCYSIYFTRTIDDIPVTYVRNTPDASEDESMIYKPRWTPEYINIQINDSGILYFEWVNPITIQENDMVIDNILPLEKIKERFRVFMMDPGDRGDMRITAVNINRITLGQMILEQPNKMGEFLLVPVWDFFGSSLIQRGDTEFNDKQPAYSHLTINAIDGSIINRKLGY